MITIARTKSLAAVIALATGVSVATLSTVALAASESNSKTQSADSLSVVMEFLPIPLPIRLKLLLRDWSLQMQPTFPSISTIRNSRKFCPGQAHARARRPTAIHFCELQTTGILKTSPSLTRSPPAKMSRYLVSSLTGP